MDDLMEQWNHWQLIQHIYYLCPQDCPADYVLNCRRWYRPTSIPDYQRKYELVTKVEYVMRRVWSIEIISVNFVKSFFSVRNWAHDVFTGCWPQYQGKNLGLIPFREWWLGVWKVLLNCQAQHALIDRCKQDLLRLKLVMMWWYFIFKAFPKK